jgi:xanthine dehydrogenase accessory factor
MTKQLQVWKFILENLKEEIPVVLLYVVESKGSSPGRQGFFMAVNARGIMKGSIGGGIMEHKFVEMAKDKLWNVEHGTRDTEHGAIKKQVHDKSAAKDQSGMICSGEQSIFLYQVRQTDRDAVQQLTDALFSSEQGTITLSPAGIKFDNNLPPQQFYFNKNSEEEWIYREHLGFRHHIHIIGGGHCGLALSRLMRMMDFYVHIYDERSMLNTMLQNDRAHEKKVIGNYSELADLIKDNEEDYVVIMTFGYRTDDIALRALINKKFRYLGVLGSKAKIAKMFSDYKAEGWSEERLSQIYAPIGINIKSQTPEEIAISIAAEIIKVKNNADKNSEDDI